MARVITVYGPKGGIAKTTTVINTAACFAREGYDTLIVDTDPQANATEGICIEEIDKTIKDLLQKEVLYLIKKGEPPWNLYDSATYNTTEPRLKIIPACPALAAIEDEMSTRASWEQILKKALSPLQDKYDFIFIDTKPSIGRLPFNALCAANEIIVPAYGNYSISAVEQMIETVYQLRQELDTDIQISGILTTQYNRSMSMPRTVREKLIETYGDAVFNTIIYQDSRLASCAKDHVSIFNYNSSLDGKTSAGETSYKTFAMELLKSWGMV